MATDIRRTVVLIQARLNRRGWVFSRHSPKGGEFGAMPWFVDVHGDRALVVTFDEPGYATVFLADKNQAIKQFRKQEIPLALHPPVRVPLMVPGKGPIALANSIEREIRLLEEVEAISGVESLR